MIQLTKVSNHESTNQQRMHELGNELVLEYKYVGYGHVTAIHVR